MPTNNDPLRATSRNIRKFKLTLSYLKEIGAIKDYIFEKVGEKDVKLIIQPTLSLDNIRVDFKSYKNEK